MMCLNKNCTKTNTVGTVSVMPYDTVKRRETIDCMLSSKSRE